MEVIIGFGQIGQAVQEAVCLGLAEVIEKDTSTEDILAMTDIEVLHVCIPYSEDFAKEIKRYMTLLSPRHVIIYSTVAIGTCNQIDPKVVHSPVEGKHPDLASSLTSMERWIGYYQREEGFYFNNYFHTIGFKTKLVPNTKFTEALKLLSTAEYGVNLVFADYKAQVSEEIGMDYKLCKEWNVEYNHLYKALGLENRFQKFVLDSPEGAIGGHCIVPNAKILNEDYPDDLLEMIIEMGGKNGI